MFSSKTQIILIKARAQMSVSRLFTHLIHCLKELLDGKGFSKENDKTNSKASCVKCIFI